MIGRLQPLLGLAELFRPATTVEIIHNQRLRAERAYFSHIAAAETHQALASAYKLRLERLNHMHREVKSGVAVELIDPERVFNQVPQ